MLSFIADLILAAFVPHNSINTRYKGRKKIVPIEQNQVVKNGAS